MSRKRIVIIEDHPMVRERISQLINKESDLEICGEAEDGASGFELIREQSPDLAIIDLTLRGSSGLDLIKKIRALSIRTKILVLSMHDESIYAERVFRAGAGGYISKNRPSAEIISAVLSVLAGEIYLSRTMTSNVVRKFAGAGMENVSTRPVTRLSDRELAVLEMIGRGLSSRAIAESLGVGAATVDTYRARIKEKMNLQNTFELQHFAIQWVRERES